MRQPTARPVSPHSEPSPGTIFRLSKWFKRETRIVRRPERGFPSCFIFILRVKSSHARFRESLRSCGAVWKFMPLDAGPWRQAACEFEGQAARHHAPASPHRGQPVRNAARPAARRGQVQSQSGCPPRTPCRSSLPTGRLTCRDGRASSVRLPVAACARRGISFDQASREGNALARKEGRCPCDPAPPPPP